MYDCMLKTSFVLSFTLSPLTTFCTSMPWSWKMILISFSRVPNPCKSLCEAKTSTMPAQDLTWTMPQVHSLWAKELLLAIFSSYQEGFMCSFSPQNLPFGFCAWQMLANLLQACRRDPAVTCHGWRRHLGTQSLPSVHICGNAFPSMHAGNNFAPALQRSHSQHARAMMVTSQKTFQADDLEDISVTSLSGPVLNMGCNILCSLGPGPGMSSHGSKWWQIHPVPWDAALPALHYSSAQKRTADFLCGFFWFPSCSSWILSCLWLLHQRFILYQSFLLCGSPDHLLTC